MVDLWSQSVACLDAGIGSFYSTIMKSPFLCRWCRLSGWFLGVVIILATARATLVVPPDFTDLVNKSDYVVRARVTAMTSEIRTTPGRSKIFTEVTLEVLETIAGQPPAQPVLEFLGGRVGDEEMIVDGSPQLKVGDESIFFVSGNGRALCPLYAMGYGIYHVKEDAATKRRYVTREDRMPMQTVAEIAHPLTDATGTAVARAPIDAAQAMTPEAFTQEIKKVLLPKSHAATSH
jgi:hypothetical protein